MKNGEPFVNGRQITRRRLLSTAAVGAAAMALPQTAKASSSSSADVLVVGAGFSGLAAARNFHSTAMLMANGKVDRLALPAPTERGEMPGVAIPPRTGIV